MSAAAALAAGLARDISVIPHQTEFVSDRVLVTQIPLEAQAAAPFLDQRVLTPQTPAAWLSWNDFETALSGAAPGALGYIFHIGHCGSTLISQLLAEAAGLRALREPLPLRSIAAEAADALSGSSLFIDGERRRRLGVLERAWSRGGAVVKATSMCNGLVDEVLETAPALFVYIAPEAYLAAMLGGANAPIDLKSWAQIRWRRLKAMSVDLPPLSALSLAELAGLAWLVETASIAGSQKKIHAVNFDAFLADPAPALAAISSHFGAAATPAQIESAVRGPLMKRYAKAPDHAYDAAQRAAILAEDRARLASEIAEGRRFIDEYAARFPAGEAALGRFAA